MAQKKTDIDDIVSSNSFFYENAFYLTSHPSRIAKLLAHYELFKLTADLPGDIVECGVFKGASFSRFVKFGNIFQSIPKKRVIGFDIFGKFPMPDKKGVKADIKSRDKFINESGEESIAKAKLMEFLENCDLAKNAELIAGDVSKTIPDFLERNPGIKISLLNIDVDLYKPTLDCLINLYDKVVTGGVIILDDYKGFPGATKAIDEFISDKPDIKINKFTWAISPFFIKKQL